MRRFGSQSAGLGLLLVLLSLTLTGCFQPVGAALEATPIGVIAALPPAQYTPPAPDEAELTAVAALQTPTEEATEVPPTETPTETPAPPTETPTVTPTETPAPPTETPTVTPTDTPSLPTALPTFTPEPTITPLPTETPLVIAFAPTATPELPAALPTFTPVPPTETPTDVPTATPEPTFTPVPPTLTPEPPTPIPSPTDVPASPVPATPELFIPTLAPEMVAALAMVVTTEPEAVEAVPPGPEGAAPEQVFPTPDVQATLFAQATQIIAIVTQTAEANAAATAAALGTPIVPIPEQPGQPVVPIVTEPPRPAIEVGPGTPTFPPGTPGLPGSGAAGPIDAGCRYTVVGGDRLIRIALRFNTTPAVLARVNGIINPNLLRPGQVLLIPDCGLPTPPPTGLPATQTFDPNQPMVTVIVVTATPFPGGTRIHVIREGETLFRIARQYGVSVTALAQVNGITNINLIYMGQRLVIP